MPYIICVELDDEGQQKESTGGLADRAYHRDELAANPNLRVDVEYYLANQVCQCPPDRRVKLPLAILRLTEKGWRKRCPRVQASRAFRCAFPNEHQKLIPL